MYVHHFVSPVRDNILGPGDRLAIWLSGCPRRCDHCISPELQIKENGVDIDIKTLFETLKPYLSNIDGVTFSGGEPFWQTHELHEFINMVRSFGVDDVLVYTGYELSEISEEHLEGITAVIDGPYKHELNTNGELPWGSSNQKLNVLDDKLKDKYALWVKNYYPKNTVQNFYSADGGVYSVGMHPQGLTDDLKGGI